MNRRTLLGRFLTIVAAVAVAPSVKAEAAPLKIIGGEIMFSEVLGAGDAPLSEWLEPVVFEDWHPGFGIAYDAAPGVDTFSAPGYALPAGQTVPIYGVTFEREG